jgi:hypothetical protein
MQAGQLSVRTFLLSADFIIASIFILFITYFICPVPIKNSMGLKHSTTLYTCPLSRQTPILLSTP